MKQTFFAIFFLHKFLSIEYGIFATESNCMCSDSIEEIFFEPGNTLPLDQPCLDVINEQRLQDVHDLAEPSGTAFTDFLITKNNCSDENEEFVCELSGVLGKQRDTHHPQTDFYYFANVESNEQKCYNPQTYHFHRIDCSGFWMMNICVPGTMDMPAIDGKCIDELRVGRSLFAESTTLCGRAVPGQCLRSDNGGPLVALGDQTEIIGFGIFTMTAATSQCCSGCGYMFSVTCLDSQSPTLKRAIEQKMKKHFPPLPRSVSFEVRNIVIPIGVNIVYTGTTVTVFSTEETLYIFKGIKVFQLYDVLNGFKTFYPSAEEIMFEGYGNLMIGYGTVQYMFEQPEIRLSDQDRNDIREFTPFIHAGLRNQTNNPNNTFSGPPGNGSGEPGPVLMEQCDPMCPDQNNIDRPESGNCRAVNFGGQAGPIGPERQRLLDRAHSLVRGPHTNPFVVRYARAFIFFYDPPTRSPGGQQ